MEIYFVTRNEASVRQPNRRSVSARSVLRSNQAATFCLRPSYHPVTVSLFYWPHRRTAVWLMIKLVRPTVRSSHVCRLTTCLSPTPWQMQRCMPPRRPSVRPYARVAVAALVAVRRGHPRSLHLPSTARRLFAGTRSLLRFRRDAAAINCLLLPRSRVDVSGGHLRTCYLMTMADASSLDRTRMKSAHRVLQPSVTVKINFFWF